MSIFSSSFRTKINYFTYTSSILFFIAKRRRLLVKRYQNKPVNKQLNLNGKVNLKRKSNLSQLIERDRGMYLTFRLHVKEYTREKTTTKPGMTFCLRCVRSLVFLLSLHVHIPWVHARLLVSSRVPLCLISSWHVFLSPTHFHESSGFL